MRRLCRLLPAAIVVTVLVGALVPDDGVRSATPEPALWVDRANPECSDAQARVLDPIHPYCTVAARPRRRCSPATR
jgi:hypothetical protein